MTDSDPVQFGVMDEESARKLTTRITLAAASVRGSLDRLVRLVEDARRYHAHVALGYPSWTAYLSDALGDDPMGVVDREKRRELVAYLTGQGMTTRAVGNVLGVDQSTVVRDLHSGDANASPEPETEPVEPEEPEPEPEEPESEPVDADAVEPDNVEEAPPPPDPEPEPVEETPQPPRRNPKADPPPGYVVGLDGKHYRRTKTKTATEPSPPPAAAPLAAIDRATARLATVKLTPTDVEHIDAIIATLTALKERHA